MGYNVTTVTKYTRSPMQYNNCHRFGHTAKWCKNTNSFLNCCGNIPSNIKNKERCNLEPFGINCFAKGLPATKRNSQGKTCVAFLHVKEIPAITYDSKVPGRQAEIILRSHTPLNQLMYEIKHPTTTALHQSPPTTTTLSTTKL